MWASYWYDEVHKSTGFYGRKALDADSKLSADIDPKKAFPTLNSQQLKVYRESLPFFTFLHTFAIGIDRLNPGR